MAITIAATQAQETAFEKLGEQFSDANLWIDANTVSTDGTLYVGVNYEEGPLEGLYIQADGAIYIPSSLTSTDEFEDSDLFQHVEENFWVVSD